MQRIKTHLWFDNQAEEAVNFYVSLFNDAKILRTVHYDMPGQGKVTVVEFQLEGQEYIALDGGPEFKFNEAVSLYVDCKSQDEVDELWEKLSAGGEKGPCGWLKDKYGLSWQIVPTELTELMNDPDPAKAGRVAAAMLQMSKIEVAELRQAYEQE